MKRIAWLLSVFAVALAFADSGWDKKMFVQPIRAIGTNRIDISPVFRYALAEMNRHDSLPMPPNPMPAWKPLQLRVNQVSKNGRDLLCFPFHYSNGSRIDEGTGVVLLKNYVGKAKVVEGDELAVIAAELQEPFRYEDIHKVTRTVKAFDYGMPLTLAISNSPAKKAPSENP